MNGMANGAYTAKWLDCHTGTLLQSNPVTVAGGSLTLAVPDLVWDVALVVDVTHATDYPTVSQAQHGDIKIGKGPAITHGGPNHAEVVARLEKIAGEEEIPLQHEAISSSSGTDTDVIFWTRGGIPSALISLPNRYMHSPVELVSLKDLEQIPQLLAGFVQSVKKGEQFKVKI